MLKNNNKIAVIGLGYVGLPLAISLSSKVKILGFDKNKKRISELKKGNDRNNEIHKSKILSKKNIEFTFDNKKLKNCNVFIVTVPTPISAKNLPDLRLLKEACKLVGKFLKKGSIFVLESTVYPGCTEKYCVPILEKISKLKFNKDFYCCYSPERINPGDRKHTINNVTKIISGSNPKALIKVKKIYKNITNKIHIAKTIKVAEAAKVIENIQRDLNIALVNEISIILKKLKINTNEVLKAASTKWNFINFKPGLVGGHCIGIDPYYLTYIAKKNNYNPKVILAGRKLNNDMKNFITNKFINSLKKRKIGLKNIKVLIMGITYKENVSDLRNSQALEVIKNLMKKKIKIDIFDPVTNEKFIRLNKSTIKINKKINAKEKYDSLLILTPHEEIKKISKSKLLSLCKKKSLIFDIKNFLNMDKNYYETL